VGFRMVRQTGKKLVIKVARTSRPRSSAGGTPAPLRLGMLLFLFAILFARIAFAEPPLLSLEVEQTTLKWQDEFVLTLSIYAPADMELPPLTVDGLDQFKLQGTGKNLLQIPRGKTKRWILTYT